MLPDNETKIELLKQVLIFTEFSDADLVQVAEMLNTEFVAAGQAVFLQGDERDNVYFILSGEVEVCRTGDDGTENMVAIFDSGDSFGEDALYFRRKRSASIIACTDTELLFLNEKDFSWVRKTFPQVEPYINAFTRTHEAVNRLKIDWLGEDETISLVAQRHPIKMIEEIIVTFFFVLVTLTISVGLITFLGNIRVITFLSAGLGGFMSLLGVIAGLWSFLEWRNDYFFVTTHRVVWRERIIFRGASRQEVPLRAIQSLNVQTPNILAHAIRVGNLVVRTFNSQLVLTEVYFPNRMKDMIDAFMSKARKKSSRAELAEIRHTIRQRLGHQDEVSQTPARIPPVVQEKKRRFALFKTRFVEGGSITYRKHWSVFLGRAWLSSLALILSLMISAVATLPTLRTLGLRGLILLYFVPFCVLVWWLYNYEDWRNDIYRVTKDRIIDRDKKPFGKESFRSAPLKNIQSVGHQIPNTLGLILNVGNVKINIGDDTLTFDGVFDPALVHQDISQRMEELAVATKRAQLAQEHERMATWLEIYYDETQGDDGIIKDDGPDFD